MSLLPPFSDYAVQEESQLLRQAPLSENICQWTWRKPKRLDSSWGLMWEPHLTRCVTCLLVWTRWSWLSCGIHVHYCMQSWFQWTVLNTGKCGCTFCQTGNGSSLTPLMHSFACRQCTDGRSYTNIHSLPKVIQCNLRVVYPQASAVFSVFCGLSVGSWET